MECNGELRARQRAGHLGSDAARPCRGSPPALGQGHALRPQDRRSVPTGRPAAIDSPLYLKELREVFEVGATNSSRRPPELTDAAHFGKSLGYKVGTRPRAR